MSRKQKESAEVVWRGRLARFDKSGLTVRQFCRKEGVSDPAFYQWRKRLQSSVQRAKPSEISSDQHSTPVETFLPVSVSPAAFAEVEFPNGVRVRVPAANAEALRVAIMTGNQLCREVR